MKQNIVLRILVALSLGVFLSASMSACLFVPGGDDYHHGGDYHDDHADHDHDHG